MRPGLVLSSECQAAGSATRREERVQRAAAIGQSSAPLSQRTCQVNKVKKY